LFPVGPDVFDRIELRGIARQVFNRDLALLRSYVVVRDFTLMRRQPVPHDQQAAAQIPPEVPEEVNHLLAPDRAFHQLEVEVDEAQSGNSRHLAPVEIEFQNGSLAARRPGAHSVRALTDAALVDENYRAPFFPGFFLIAGH
jgi:hypothetical protein